MAAKKQPRSRKKPVRRFQFQLSWSGLFGVIIVAFCLFLWMFMLGVWAGQTILLPHVGTKPVVALKKGHQPTHMSPTLPEIHPLSKKRQLGNQ
jgi:hypothetical protein